MDGTDDISLYGMMQVETSLSWFEQQTKTADED